MKRSPLFPGRIEAGSALVTALLMVFVFSIVAANVLLSVSSRYNSAYRSASWNEALQTAESGIDVLASEITRGLPDVRATTDGLGTGFSEPSLGLITGLQISPAGLISNGTLLNLNLPPLVHGGEGGTTQQATVSLDVVPLSTLLDSRVPGLLDSLNGLLGGNDLQLLRLRSTGTVSLTGGTRAGMSRLDNELWRVSLLTDRLTGAKLSTPTVARQIEVVLRPVFAFEGAVVSDGTLLVPDAGTVFDSFNSSLSTASTNGQYDSAKRLSHAIVRTNGADFTLGGKVWGNIETNGGSVAKDFHVSGAVNNASYKSLPLVKTPLWSGSPFAPSSVLATTTIPAGPVLLPAQYKFNTISGNLHITKGLAGLGTNVDIYVKGDITGGIEIDPGITARLYVSGSITTDASKLKNDSGVASAMQIYGVPTSASSSPSIRIRLDSDLTAAVYAPAHGVYFTGNNDVSGSVVAASLQMSGAVRVHYDEALGFTTGPLLRYQIASWKEIVP